MADNAVKPLPFGPDTIIAEAESRVSWEVLKSFYREHGIKCLDCPAAMIQTFAEGAKLHGFDLEMVLAKLNQLEAEAPFDGYPPTFMQRMMRKVFGKKP